MTKSVVRSFARAFIQNTVLKPLYQNFGNKHYRNATI